MNIKTFEELGYTVKAELGNNGLYIECIVYRIEYTVENDSKYERIPFYLKNQSDEHTDKPEESVWFCKGSIKWDYCSNWEFNSSTGLHHYCSQEELKNVGLIMSSCFDLAKEMIGDKFYKY